MSLPDRDETRSREPLPRPNEGWAEMDRCMCFFVKNERIPEGMKELRFFDLLVDASIERVGGFG